MAERVIIVTDEQEKSWRERLNEFFKEVEITDEEFLDLEFPPEDEFCCVSDVCFFVDLAEEIAGNYQVELFWGIYPGNLDLSAEPVVVDDELEAADRQHELDQDKEMF